MTDKLPPKIFVIEENDLLRTSLCNTIERYWFSVSRAKDQDTAIRLITVTQPNLIIISSNIPNVKSTDLAEQIRKLDSCQNVPIVFLIDGSDDAAKYMIGEDQDLVEVITRPYTPNEIMTSIKSLLRKSKPVFQDKIIRYKNLTMDLATYKVMQGNKQIHLGPTEFKILQLLVQSPKTIFSRQQVIDYVWGIDSPVKIRSRDGGSGKDKSSDEGYINDRSVKSRTVDVHINRLRSLIKQHETDIPFIKTVRASGYCLNLPGEID